MGAATTGVPLRLPEDVKQGEWIIARLDMILIEGEEYKKSLDDVLIGIARKEYKAKRKEIKYDLELYEAKFGHDAVVSIAKTKLAKVSDLRKDLDSRRKNLAKLAAVTTKVDDAEPKLENCTVCDTQIPAGDNYCMECFDVNEYGPPAEQESLFYYHHMLM